MLCVYNTFHPIQEEMDSYMYQTVGYKGVVLASQALGLPLYKAVISGTAVKQGQSNLTFSDIFIFFKHVT